MTVHGAIIRKRGHPDIRALLRLLEDATDTTQGSRARLAELLGCGPATIRRWERGTKRPSLAYMVRLRELEKNLLARKRSINDELRDGAGQPRRAVPLTLCATTIAVTVEGEHALLRFGLKVPGEDEARTIAEVLLPKAALESALGPHRSE